MPKYEVIKKGFFNGQMYSPTGKRPYLVVETPFKPCPDWLKPMKAETPAEKKKRIAAEKKAAVAAEKKAVADAQEIENANFLGEGEGVVESLG